MFLVSVYYGMDIFMRNSYKLMEVNAHYECEPIIDKKYVFYNIIMVKSI